MSYLATFWNRIIHVSHSLTRSPGIESIIPQVLTLNFLLAEDIVLRGRVPWGCLRSFVNLDMQIFCQGAQTKRRSVHSVHSMHQCINKLRMWRNQIDYFALTSWLSSFFISLFIFLSRFRILGVCLFTFYPFISTHHDRGTRKFETNRGCRGWEEWD